eukprot:212886_1
MKKIQKAQPPKLSKMFNLNLNLQNKKRREWIRMIKKEIRDTDRQIRKDQYYKKKMESEMKRCAKRYINDDGKVVNKQEISAIRIQAKTIALNDKRTKQLYQNKVLMNSVILKLKEQQEMDRIYEKYVVYGYSNKYLIPNDVKNIIVTFYRIHVFRFGKWRDEIDKSMDKLVRNPFLYSTFGKMQKEMIDEGVIIQMIGGPAWGEQMSDISSDDMYEKIDEIIDHILGNIFVPVIPKIEPDYIPCKCGNSEHNDEPELDLQTRLNNLKR